MVFWILCYGSLYGQEDCFNGIDDDNDGLIDLWDQDCYCVQTNGTLFFSDFEEMSCCPWRFTIPNFPGGIDCLGGMSSATEATSDYFNTCNYIGEPGATGPPLVPFPIPSGTGVVGTISTSTYVEYVGACLPIELIGGFEYEFSMQVGFNSNLLCVSLSPFTVAIYGTSDCANYPVENDDCLNTNPDWYLIGTMTVSAMLGEWAYVSGTFTAPYNTAAIAFGGFCSVESTANNYHFFDDFMISGPGNPQLEVDEITETGDCASGVTLSTTPVSGGSYQWYLDGIAIAGATDPTYEIPAGGEGSYRVMTIKNGLCGVSLPFEVEIDENTLTWNEEINHIPCYGENNGSIEIMLPGNHPPYEINWSSGHNTPLAEELAPGNYMVTVTDAYGCYGTAQYTISEPPELDVFITAITQPGGSQNSGEASIAIAGGVEPYFIEWSTGGNGYKEKNLQPGYYSITVTDDHGCIDTLGFTIISAIQSQINYVTSSCHVCDGSITINVIGGINPVSINIADQNGKAISNTGSALNLCGEKYIYTIIDGAGNKVQDTLNLENKNKPIILLDSIQAGICVGDTSGLISVMVTGGTPSYTYKWSNGDSSAQIKKLLPGNYALTVTDLAGCIDTVHYQLDSLKPVLTTIQTVAAGCTIGGEGTVLALQGNGPVKWKWSTGDTTSTVKNLLAGNYIVTVSDSLGCRKLDTIDIAQEGGIAVEGQVVNSHCSEISDGEITVTVLAANGNVIFNWSNGQTTPIIENLSVGAYRVTLTDELGCQSVQLYEVKEEPQAQLTSVISPNPCAGQSQASIHLSLQDENDHDFLWSDGSTSPNLQDLKEGLYQVTTTDIYGCRQQLDVEIKDPPTLVAMIESSHPRCFGKPDGFITIAAVGGTGTIFHTINGVITQDSLTNLGPGTYNVMIQDANGCAIEDTLDLVYRSYPTLEGIVTEAVCDSISGAKIELTTSGGIEPYSCRWDTGYTGTIYTNLASGRYIVTITDQLGCMVNDTFFVAENNKPVIQLSGSNPDCYGGQGGTLIIDVSSTNGPFDVFVNGNKIDDTILSNLYAGIYLVEVEDAKGCKTSAQYEITEPQLLTGMVTNVVQPDQNVVIGKATVTAMGGTAPYTFKWDNGEPGASASNLLPGLHQVSITDGHGCATVLDVVIVKSKIYAGWQSTDNICFGDCNGEISIDIQNEDGTELLKWSDGGTGKVRTMLCAGKYQCTLSDAYGNALILSEIEVLAPPALQIAVSVDGESCPGKNDGVAVLTLSGGVPDFMILWDGIAGEYIAQLDTGKHQIKIVDANGCIKDSMVLVLPKTTPTLDVKTIDILCESRGKIILQSNESFIQTINVNGASYLLENFFELDITSAGIYTIEQHLSDSCIIDRGEWEIKEETFVMGNVKGGTIDVKQGNEIDLDLSSITFNGNYHITWIGLPQVSCVQEDSYGNCIRQTYFAESTHQVTVEVTSAEGCDTMIVFNIMVLVDNELFFPNVFGGNSNPVFKPVDKTGSTFIYKFSIYDRWGNLVYNESDTGIRELKGWDGTFKGQSAETGVYIYSIEVSTGEKEKRSFMGDVTRVR